MRILGIDPSTTATGYGLIEVDGHNLKPVAFGVIRTDAKQHLHQRLKKIHDELVLVIQEYKPDVVALEDVFYSRNIKVALQIGQARGAAIIAAVNHGLSVHEYAPREVKQSVTGIGSASKEQVQQMVQRLLHLKEPPSPLDVSDALGIAICHLFRTQKKVSL